MSIAPVTGSVECRLVGYVRWYREHYDTGPTYREIAEHLGYAPSSSYQVQMIVHRLLDDGSLSQTDKARSLNVANPPPASPKRPAHLRNSRHIE
jgi:hypothetical protein